MASMAPNAPYDASCFAFRRSSDLLVVEGSSANVDNVKYKASRLFLVEGGSGTSGTSIEMQAEEAARIHIALAVAPAAYICFQCRKRTAVRVIHGELRGAKRENILEGGRAPSKVVFSRATTTAVCSNIIYKLGGGRPL